MRKTTCVFLICVTVLINLLMHQTSHAETYYIDYASGDNTRTAQQARSQSTPWKTAPGMLADWRQITGGWTEVSGNIWEAVGPITYPTQMRLGASTRLQFGAWSTCCSAGTFSYSSSDSHIVRVYSEGNPDTANGAVYVTRSDGGTRTGYTHAAGDRFVFKGGVTWPADTLPFTILWSGNEENVDEYTVDRTWFAGSSWARPRFVGGGKHHVIYALGKSYLLFDNLYLDANSTACSDTTYVIAAYILAGSLEIKYCYLTQAKVAFAGGPASTDGNANGFYFHHNDVADVCNCMVAAGPYTGAGTWSDLQIYNNNIAGITDIDPGDDHPDGLQLFGDKEWSITGLKIYNNKFTGFWNDTSTGQIFLQWAKDVEIYNNVFAFENSNTPRILFSPGAITLGGASSQHNDNVKIYGNTFSSDGDYSDDKGMAKGISVVMNQGKVDIKNNIFSKVKLANLISTAFSTYGDRTLYLKYDEGTTTEITVAQGYLSPDQLAAVVQEGIDAAFSISSSVTYNADGDYKFKISAPAGHTFSYSPEGLTRAQTALMTVMGFTSSRPAAQNLKADAVMKLSELSIDNNLYDLRSGGTTIASTHVYYDRVGADSPACTNRGWDCHSLFGDPRFVALPNGTLGSGNFSLQADSAAINAADSGIGQTYNTDIRGLARGTAWDIGAYEYAESGADTVAPSAPAGLTVN